MVAGASSRGRGVPAPQQQPVRSYEPPSLLGADRKAGSSSSSGIHSLGMNGYGVGDLNASTSSTSLSVASTSGSSSTGTASSLANTKAVVARLERDLKIRDGADHFLSRGSGGSDLRTQVRKELFAALVRIATAFLAHPYLPTVAEEPSEMLHTAGALAEAAAVGEPADWEYERLALALLLRVTQMIDGSVRMRYELDPEDVVAGTFPCMAERVSTELRAAAYNLLRHALVEPPWELIGTCHDEGLDLYLSRTFQRDHRYTLEKEQALKLVRAAMECGAHSSDIPFSSANGNRRSGLDGYAMPLISPAIVRSLAAAADQSDEPLRLLYIETLGELGLLGPHDLAQGGGMRVLLLAASDPSNDLAPELTSALVTLIDMPATRSIFKPGLDLDGVFAPLTDARGGDEDASLHAAAQLAGLMLRSWTGFMYMCINDKGPLRAIISSLGINSSYVQNEILDMLSTFFATGGRSQSDAEPRTGQAAAWAPRFRQLDTPSGASRINLIESYKLLVAINILGCGIMDSLVRIIEARPALTDKVLRVMEQLRSIAAKYIPGECSYRMHTVPDLFRTRFGDGHDKHAQAREVASGVLDTLNRFSTKSFGEKTNVKSRERSDSSKQAARPPLLVDDSTFRTLLLEANVLGTKDHTKWSYEALQTLFDGVLQSPKRLEEAMRASKLVRRVLAFYHPFAMRYSVLPKNANNQNYTKLGCSVLRTLLLHADGMKFLSEDRLLVEIGESFETDIMSERCLESTMASGYLDFIGVLSASREGLELLHQGKVVTTLYRLMDQGNRLDIARSLLNLLDFSTDGHARIFLARILAHPIRKVRVEGTRQLADVARNGASRWIVRLLVRQLYDPASEVRELASNILLRECTKSKDTLEMVVSMRPMLEEGAHALLLKFLSTSQGLQYLMQGDYINKEMDEWFHRRNFVYAMETEVLLSRAFNPRRQSDDAQLDWDGCVPPHFYGELVKTPEGRAVLTQKGHFVEFAHFVRQHADEDADGEVLLKLKSILWAIGNMGASLGGVPFLECEDIVSVIVKMANTTRVFSLRGTCYFVLGMIATTQQGAELVQDEGWGVRASLWDHPPSVFGVCIPSPEFVTIPRWKPWQPPRGARMPPPSSVLESEILQQLASLGNAILVAKASRALTKLKDRYPAMFVVPDALLQHAEAEAAALAETQARNANQRTSTSDKDGLAASDDDDAVRAASEPLSLPYLPPPRAVELFVRALDLMETHPIRQTVRRYIWELFEVRLDVATVRAIQQCRAVLMASSSMSNGSSPETR